MMDSEYSPPLALTIISSISIGIAGLAAIWILLDIIIRRGWRTMMAIMIPVYVINALYLWPITLWTYLKYGRPAKPGSKEAEKGDGGHAMHHGDAEAASAVKHEHEGHHAAADVNQLPGEKGSEGNGTHSGLPMHSNHDHQNHEGMMHDQAAAGPHPDHNAAHDEHAHHTVPTPAGDGNPARVEPTKDEPGNNHGGNASEHHNGESPDKSKPAATAATGAGGHNMHAHMHGGGDLPMFANVTIAVCHCGAGCVLGDLIGEWIVYASGATINGQDIWAEWLIDFALALFFGIFFQYFSIAPATGEYGLKTIWRATTADFFSLVAFEIGLFGWMAIFQIAAFKWMLEMNTVTYWFMMQIGMFFGHWTAVPVNYWLLTSNIKVAIH